MKPIRPEECNTGNINILVEELNYKIQNQAGHRHDIYTCIEGKHIIEYIKAKRGIEVSYSEIDIAMERFKVAGWFVDKNASIPPHFYYYLSSKVQDEIIDSNM